MFHVLSLFCSLLLVTPFHLRPLLLHSSGKRHRTRTVTDEDDERKSAAAEGEDSGTEEEPPPELCRFEAVCTGVARACLFLCLAVVGPDKLDTE